MVATIRPGSVRIEPMVVAADFPSRFRNIMLWDGPIALWVYLSRHYEQFPDEIPDIDEGDEPAWWEAIGEHVEWVD